MQALNVPITNISELKKSPKKKLKKLKRRKMESIFLIAINQRQL